MCSIELCSSYFFTLHSDHRAGYSQALKKDEVLFLFQKVIVETGFYSKWSFSKKKKKKKIEMKTFTKQRLLQYNSIKGQNRQ